MKSITIFGLANKENMTYGHGDFGEELHITSVKGYGMGGFPPFFLSREAAQKYLEKSKYTLSTRYIVELTLNIEDKIFTLEEILDFAIEYLQESSIYDDPDLHEIKMDQIDSLLIALKVVMSTDELKDNVHVRKTIQEERI